MLKFNVTGDNLVLELKEGRDKLNSGSKDYYTAEFTFDNDWDRLIPHIVVIENGVERPNEVIIDNTHKIATTESGIMQIGVYGLDSNGKMCISSNFVCIEVRPGAYTGVTPIPADIWDGYQIIVLGYMERAEGAAADAKSSADKAATSAENAKVSEEAAAESKTVTEKLAKRAETAADNAEKFAGSVSDMTVNAETLLAGEKASVKKSQADGIIHLEFGIPKGEQGIQGIQGEKGDKGDKGDSYILTDEDKTEIGSDVSAEIEAELNAALDEIIAIQEDLMTPDGDEVSY